MATFQYQKLFEHSGHDTPWRRLDVEGIRTVQAGGRTVLQVESSVLTELVFQAVRDISHLFRPGHLAQLRAILEDPEASANDRFVALQLLKNANVSAGMVLPS